MRRLVVVVVAVLVALSVLGFMMRASLATYVMKAAASRAIRADFVSSLPDGLHLILCGAGSPLPDPRRSGPCVAVVAGRSLFVVDAGSGAARNLQRMRVPNGEIASLFLTHFHSDHIDGLGELAMMRWVAAANREPLPVYGPAGVEEVVAGFNRAYRLDSEYRTAHHGNAVAPPQGAGMRAHPIEVPADGTAVTVWSEDAVRITAFGVDHEPVSPAVGYRFEYRDRSLVISGDTKKMETVSKQATGVDLLVHEALAAHLVAILNRSADEAGNEIVTRITHDIPEYHTTPIEAAEVARTAGVRALLYYHIVPALPLPGLEAAFLRGVKEAYDGPVVVGRDGTMVSLPSGSKEIKFSNRL
jgi:ribonuclease Z